MHRRLENDDVRAVTLLWLFLVLLGCVVLAKVIIVCLHAAEPKQLAKPRAKTAVYIDPTTLQSIVYIVALSPVHERSSDDAAFSTTGRISNFGGGPLDDADVEWSITDPTHSRV